MPKVDATLELESRIAALEAAPLDRDMRESQAAADASKEFLIADEPRCSAKRLNFANEQVRLESVVTRRAIRRMEPFYHPEGDLPSLWLRMKALPTDYSKECPGFAGGKRRERTNLHVGETMALLQASYRDNVLPRYTWAPPTIEAAADRLPALRAKANAEFEAQQAGEQATLQAQVRACTQEALGDMPNESNQLRGEMVRVCENGLRK